LKRSLSNSIILILFQIAVFTAPIAIKGLHTHNGHPEHKTYPQGINLVPTEKPCPICDYEFVTFDRVQDEIPAIVLPIVSYEKPLFYSFYTDTTFALKTGRAPPVAVS
jgi:hypothetical protein